MQLKACLALLPPPQHRSLPPMATVYVTEDKGVGEEPPRQNECSPPQEITHRVQS